MTDKKISQLTAASTPLDGTEVLPIVQSSATVKVANNDLRPKQIQSNATSGVLQIAGPAATSTRVMTTPDANFTVARTDAANSFTGNQTLSTGNVVQGTAAKGFDFSANSTLAGKTSTLLNWYEEGTWTPTFTNCGTASASNATYTRIGRLVTVNLTFTATSITANSSRFTLPIAAGSLAPGTWTRNTVEGGFLEVQASTLCYFASTPTATTGTFYAVATYVV